MKKGTMTGKRKDKGDGGEVDFESDNGDDSNNYS